MSVDYESATGAVTANGLGPPPGAPTTGARWTGRLLAFTPGIAAAAAIAAAATVLGGLVPVIGAPVIAIVSGMAVAAARPGSARLAPGLSFTAKRVLQGSIVVLGFGLSLHQVLVTGAASLPVLLGSLVAALGTAFLVGRLLHLRRDVTTLVGVGTAICGASAIAATDAVIGADEADVSYAIATIFTFNVMAVLTFPAVGHLLGLSQRSFGLWAGTAINDASSVVAASTVYGHAAAAYGVVVKLTRTLAIVPISLGLALWRNRGARAGAPGSPPPGAEGATPTPATGRRVPLRRIVPLFILGFLAAVSVNSLGLVPGGWHRGLGDLATWMITAALAAIGLSTRFSHVRRAGIRPIALGAVLWVTVAVVSLSLQAATGTL